MTTEFLYDAGEESWSIKVHVGCGDKYLPGYKNVDVIGKLARHSGGLVRANKTDIKDYYGNNGASLEYLPPQKETVVDIVGDFSELSFNNNSVSKILCIQALEHLPQHAVDKTLENWWNVLVVGGVLILSVPDMDGISEWLTQDEEHRNFAIRHLRGSLKNKYSKHVSWFNKETLEALLIRHGFDYIEWLPNFHFYPCLVVKCKKIDPSLGTGRRDWIFPLWEYDASVCQTFLDVGPGQYPMPMATRCVDIDDTYAAFRNAPCDIADVQNLPYRDNEWDYLVNSHCAEHVEHPAKAIAEIQRVSKRGYAEVPSVMIDFIFQHGKTHERWMCLGSNDNFVFVEKDDTSGLFTNNSVGAYTHRIMHYPIPLSEPERDWRFHFWTHQNQLNIRGAWNKETSRKITALEIRLNGEVWLADGEVLKRLK